MSLKDEILAEIYKDQGQERTAEAILALLPQDLEVGWQESNDRMRRVVSDSIVPAVLALWLKKNADYAGQQVFLGRTAQFADINRKFWKLKQAMWDGQLPGFENVREIAMDMIGHLLMTIYMEDELSHHHYSDEYGRLICCCGIPFSEEEHTEECAGCVGG